MAKDLFLITGASSGIGLALVQSFAAEGHCILAGVRSQADLEKLRTIPNVEPFILDITKQKNLDDVPPLIASKLDHYRKFILINNAGVVVKGPWELVADADIRQQFEVNVLGVIFLTQKCLPFLRRSKGRVINISSVAGLFAAPFLGPYAASKYAIEAFSHSLRRELMAFGVPVILINPAAIQTPIWQKGLQDPKNEILQKDPVYGAQLKSFESGVLKAVEGALDVSHVVKAVDHAYKAEPAPVRTIVAKPALVFFLRLSQFIPERWFDRLFSRF